MPNSQRLLTFDTCQATVRLPLGTENRDTESLGTRGKLLIAEAASLWPIKLSQGLSFCVLLLPSTSETKGNVDLVEYEGSKGDYACLVYCWTTSA